MLKSDLITLIRQRLLRNYDTSLDASIEAEVNLVIDRYESAPLLPAWLQIDGAAGFQTTANTESVSVPINFIRFIDNQEIVLWRYDNEGTGISDQNWLPLRRKSFSEMLQRHNTIGPPEYYDILAKSDVSRLFILYFRPIPDAVYALRPWYYSSTGEISDYNPWLHFAADVLVAETVYVMATQYVFIPSVAAQAEKDIARARERLYHQVHMFDEDAYMRDMGDD